jgi:DNA-directed RNA polymerase specialized sigma subunit
LNEKKKGVDMAKITREIIEQGDKEGKGDKQIAEENGVSRQAVYQMRKKYGLQKKVKGE